jgi:drug/metabolite transporter (DMT)-like permease
LLLLSLLWAVGWVRADLEPGAVGGIKLSPLLSEAVLLGVLAVVAAITGVILKKAWPLRDYAFRTLLAGIGLFVVPSVLIVLVRERIDDTTRVALFSLTPLFAVVFEPHFGVDGGTAEKIRGGFAAAMIAVAGTFLVFPFELPRSYGAAAALLGVIAAAASVAAANSLGVEILQERRICALTFAAMSAGAAAAVLGIAGLVHIRSGSESAVLGAWAFPELIALALLFWLMTHMSAAQMTTRFLIAPLMANLISLVLVRPHVEMQAWIGLCMIAGGSGWILFARPDRSTSNPKLFDLE